MRWTYDPCYIHLTVCPTPITDTPLLRVLLLAGSFGIGSFNVFYYTVWTPFLQYRFGWTSTDIALSAILGFIGTSITVASVPKIVEHIGDFRGIILPIPLLCELGGYS